MLLSNQNDEEENNSPWTADLKGEQNTEDSLCYIALVVWHEKMQEEMKIHCFSK